MMNKIAFIFGSCCGILIGSVVGISVGVTLSTMQEGTVPTQDWYGSVDSIPVPIAPEEREDGTSFYPEGAEYNLSNGRMYDVNGDGLINCIDKALEFYSLTQFYGYTPKLMYGEELPGNNGKAHLWINVSGNGNGNACYDKDGDGYIDCMHANTYAKEARQYGYKTEVLEDNSHYDGSRHKYVRVSGYGNTSGTFPYRNENVTYAIDRIYVNQFRWKNVHFGGGY
jgi:hypothetical protein